MNGSGDLRVQRTYRLLFDAFTSLLEEEGFDSITVQQLCDRAMIRRTTFYKHFADKDEFFAFYVRRISSEFKLRCAPVDGWSSALECQTHMSTEFLRFIAENPGLVHMCLTSSAFSVLDSMLFDEITRSLGLALREQEAKDDVFCAPSGELCRYTAGGFLRSFYQFVTTHPDLAVPDIECFESQMSAIAARLLTPLSTAKKGRSR